MEFDKKVLEKFIELSEIYDFTEVPDSVKIALMNALALEKDLVPEEEDVVESIFDKILVNLKNKLDKFGNFLVENWVPITLGLAILTVVIARTTLVGHEIQSPSTELVVVKNQYFHENDTNDQSNQLNKHIFEGQALERKNNLAWKEEPGLFDFLKGLIVPSFKAYTEGAFGLKKIFL